MRFGLQIPDFTFPGGAAAHRETLTNIARAAQDSGFESLWVMDHFFQIPVIGEPELPMHDGPTALAFLAGVTETIELGTLVASVVYRQPAQLVKEFTTLDVLSGGRAWFGVGAAWFQQEADALGLKWPALRERFNILEDTLRLARQMWSDGHDAPFTGNTVDAKRTLTSPQPVRRPPVLIGGTGPRRTLRLVAEYADASNFFGTPEDMGRHNAVLDAHCADLGRDPSEILRTRNTIARAGEQGYSDIAASADHGIQKTIVIIPEVWNLENIETFRREVMARF